ncbi:hypothetical protein OG948_40575 (plasmid) [Embleya sp. NBC_00888]|uniref:hypothetical protein n=1 Tax=Embleya sp. NBC_00888 TaxID=2975960 RepID=UPI002F919BC1|nr:hypothetical protein OG948_40575 [Embleya sp. NBC_00888]
MTLNGHRRFGGLPVAELHEIPHPRTTEANSAPATPPDPLPRARDAAWALRVGNSYRGHSITESFPALFARFLETADSTEVSAIVIGLWGDHHDSAAVPMTCLPRPRIGFRGCGTCAWATSWPRRTSSPGFSRATSRPS